jgi:membrane protein implicated in regulation of membrane protease activity
MYSPSLTWFICGIVLIILELLVPLPTLWVAAAIGLAALIISGILWLVYIPVLLQFLIWAGSSAFCVWYSRRFVPKGNWKIKDADEGVTLTEILPGESGRVKYEGNSWKARCEDLKLSIPASETVYILRKQGTTLIVVPKSWLDHHNHTS